MQVKMSEIIDLENVYEKIGKQTISIKTAYKISKFFNAVHSEYEFYDKEVNKLLEKYAEKDENGNFKKVKNNEGIQIAPEHLNKAKDELNALMDLEVQLPDMTLKLDELDKICLSIKEITALMPFIEDN